MTSINTLFDIIDKENTTINSLDEINTQLHNNDTSLNYLLILEVLLITYLN